MVLGLLFGSFDPIHNGHLGMIEQALNNGCDEVWLVVQPFNAYKPNQPAVSLQDRLEMAKLALVNHSGVLVGELDPDIAVYHSVLETLREFKGLDDKRELVLILGLDLTKSFDSWVDRDEIMKLCRLLKVKRGADDVSSGQIRKLVGQAKSIEGLVPDTVATYIINCNLY